jgi:glucokinase
MEVALIGDIGGTNARFALLRNGKPVDVRVLPVADYPSLESAAKAYLAGLDKSVSRPRHAALDVAGPVTGDRLSFTNHPWSFSQNELKAGLGLNRLIVVNDFVAAAMSVPRLKAGDCHRVGPGAPGAPVAGMPIAVIGPGTGLGVSILAPCGEGAALRYNALASEGGHATLAAAGDREAAIIAWLHAQGKDHVSAEGLLSGPGLSTLVAAISAIDGLDHAPMEPPAVTDHALRGDDEVAVEALAMFCALLGAVAGNLALIAGARGGVYIAGGIVPRLGEFFDRSEFRARFTAKGRMRSFLEPIPTYVITHEMPAFLGLAELLARD